jgi:hypothetical protein
LRFRWAAAISTAEWHVYRAAIRAVQATGMPFMLGGGFALAAFTGRWRDTKDIDFYIRSEHRDVVTSALAQAGFEDYFRRLPYDRKWIYRSIRSNVIVDIIWSMANQRAQVDPVWFERAGSVSLRGEKLQVVPLEELIWCKLYILQRDHCDWTDILNLLYAVGSEIDWAHLLDRLEDDTPLLKGVLSVFGWLCPRGVLELPPSLWERLEMRPPPREPQPPSQDRIRLLDSRCWFAALQPEGGKLGI